MPFNSRLTMSCVYRFCCLDRIAYTSGLLLQMSHVPWSCLSVNSSVCWTHRWTVQTRMNRSPLFLKATFNLPQGNVHSLSRRPSFSLKATFTLSQGDPHSPSRQRSISLKATLILSQGNVHSPSRRPSFSLKATFTLPQGDPHSPSRRPSRRPPLETQFTPPDTTKTASSRCVCRWVWIAL